MKKQREEFEKELEKNEREREKKRKREWTLKSVRKGNVFILLNKIIYKQILSDVVRVVRGWVEKVN
jgi:hypothetical protein